MAKLHKEYSISDCGFTITFTQFPRDHESKKKACLHHVKEDIFQKERRNYRETTTSNHFASNLYLRKTVPKEQGEDPFHYISLGRF